MQKISRRDALAALGAAAFSTCLPARAQSRSAMQSWPLNAPARTAIHDVAPASDRGVWYTAQASGHLGYFDPKSGRPSWSRSGASPRRTA